MSTLVKLHAQLQALIKRFWSRNRNRSRRRKNDLAMKDMSQDRAIRDVSDKVASEEFLAVCYGVLGLHSPATEEKIQHRFNTLMSLHSTKSNYIRIRKRGPRDRSSV